MRFVAKTYDNGQSYVVETDNDATEVLTQEGQRQVGQRISATIEVLADDNIDGLNRVLEALRVLETRVEEKKNSIARGAA